MQLRALFSLLVLTGVGAAAEAVAPPVPREIAAWIETYAASQSSDGVAPSYYPAATRIAEGRLGREFAAAIVFTLEGAGGGNNYLQYLAVFWKRGQRYTFCCAQRVGGKGIRSVEHVALSGAGVRIGGNEYAPGKDPMCCPSKPYVADLAVQGTQLLELRVSDNPWRDP